MSVNLISYSKPLENGLESLEDLVCYCARVSNPTNQHIQNNKKNEKLIRYLMYNLHWSPFEMVSICLEIVTTRDIARQILRHRSFSFQEFSQRYAIADMGFERRECRLQDNKNRQNSIKLINCDIEDCCEKCEENCEFLKNKKLIEDWNEKQNDIFEKVKDTYEWAISNGIAKEQARAILPEGNTISKMYVNGTLRSWIHYIQLRSGNGTQLEHREIAVKCADAIQPIFPMIREFLSE
jgi:thymidylate synthase (FAD)